MKKNLARKITLSILASAVLMSSNVAWAAVTVAPTTSGQDGWSEVTVSNYSVWHTSGVEIQFGTGISTDKNFASAFNSNGDATGGKVTISGGTFVDDDDDDKDVYIYGGCVYGGNGYATGGEVTISGGTFNNIGVRGGYVVGSPGYASDNKVEISKVDENSTFGFISGGEAYGDNGNANNNRVTLSAKDATYKRDIYGGYSDEGDATGNVVTISGGTFDGVSIYGGCSSGGDAEGNTVNISGEADLSSAWLSGGYSASGTLSDNVLNVGVNDTLRSELAQKGITVEVGAWQNNKVKSITGFDVINFYNLEWVNGKTIVETEEAQLSPTGTKINVYVASGNMNLNESMTLIKSVADITGKVHDDSKQSFEIFEGVDKVYEGQISQPDNKSIIVKIVGEDEVPGDGGGTGGGAGDGTAGGEDGEGSTGGDAGGSAGTAHLGAARV